MYKLTHDFEGKMLGFMIYLLNGKVYSLYKPSLHLGSQFWGQIFGLYTNKYGSKYTSSKFFMFKFFIMISGAGQECTLKIMEWEPECVNLSYTRVGKERHSHLPPRAGV